MLLFKDGHLIHLRSETVVDTRRINVSGCWMMDIWYPVRMGLNFLIFVLQLRKSPKKYPTRKLSRPGIELWTQLAGWEASALPPSHSGVAIVVVVAIIIVLLKQDNARPHTARTTTTKIEELRGFELLPRPRYSSDLAPWDYHLFRSMAHLLRGRYFENFEPVEVGLTEFFASKIRDWYRRGIINLAERWLRTIECDGRYFEG